MVTLASRADAVAASAPSIDAAADLLAGGRLVAFPTETVYGLGAWANDAAAVHAIYAAKGRPLGHPLIVHVTGADAARRYASAWPEVAARLVAAFWPGPLTVVVPRAAGVAAEAAAQQPTIALRAPSHPVARALLAAAAERGVRGVAAPSANRYGRVSPTRADHVRSEFGPELAVLDGGDAEIGIESSIVDCSGDGPVLLRPGSLTAAALERAAGQALRPAHAQSPRAPGQHAAHYAPSARLALFDRLHLDAALGALCAAPPARHRPAMLAVYSRARPTLLPQGALHRTMPASPSGVAHELYAVLRSFDSAGATDLWVEQPPGDAAWDGVRDRLLRAAAAG